MTDILEAHKVHDVSKSSRAIPHSVCQPLAEQKAYVTMGALENFMATMTDTLL